MATLTRERIIQAAHEALNFNPETTINNAGEILQGLAQAEGYEVSLGDEALLAGAIKRAIIQRRAQAEDSAQLALATC
jgi:hypothetical protein